MDIIKSEPDSDNEIDPLSSHCEFQLVNIKYEDQSEETTFHTPRSESRSSMDIKKEEHDSDTEAHCISSCSEDQLTDMKQEEFLVPVPIPALESETNPQQTDEMPPSTPSQNEDQDKENTRKEEEKYTDNTTTKRTNDIKTKSNVPKKRTKHMTPQYFETELDINESFNTLNQVLQNKKDEDDCDLYTKLLAKKLRKYPEAMRQRIMYKIDGLLLDNPYPISSSSTYSMQSPYSCYTNSMPSPTYVKLPQSSAQISIPENSEMQRNKITILSQEVLEPSTSTNVIESAFINAITDDNCL